MELENDFLDLFFMDMLRYIVRLHTYEYAYCTVWRVTLTNGRSYRLDGKTRKELIRKLFNKIHEI